MNTEELRKQAESLLLNGRGKAEGILEDGGKLDQLLEQAESKLETVPKAGEYLAEIPRMIALLKDHIQKDYTDAPKKTLVLIVAALLYLVNPKDIIPDKYLGVGLIDDAAVIAACIALTKDDLATYDVWRKAKVASKESESARTEAAEAKEVILPDDEVIPE